MLVDAKVDFSQKRNLIITSVILVLGIGGARVHLGGVEIGEMSLATYVGILLNLVLPQAGDEGEPGHVVHAETQPDL
jgi:uracil permease